MRWPWTSRELVESAAVLFNHRADSFSDPSEHIPPSDRARNVAPAVTMETSIDPSVSADRARERLAHRISRVRERIAAACGRAQRDLAEVRLVAVTKTFPIEVVRMAISLGLTDFGENRVQELDQKTSELPGHAMGSEINWHLVGSLQRNKAKRAVQIADEFHALDSERLAAELDRRAASEGRILPCYVQVNVSGEGTKSGLAPDETHPFLSAVSSFDNLVISGLMTLAAPVDTDEELETIVRPQFRELARLARACPGGGNIRLPLRLSMGMSDDFEVAIEEGATDIRLGTILFGERD